MNRDTGLWLAVGGAALVGGWLWLRSRPAAPGAPDTSGWDWIGSLADQIELATRAGAVPVSGPGPYTQQTFPQQPAPVARLGSPGTPGSTIAMKSGIAVGGGAAIGAIGPGSALMGAATAGIGAGIGVLVWSITEKGLFRGGEEALYVNPARDRYLAFFGPPGTGPESGFGRLAAQLTEITGEPNGSHYFEALKRADTVEKLVDATGEIQAVFASVGISVPAYVE